MKSAFQCAGRRFAGGGVSARIIRCVLLALLSHYSSLGHAQLVPDGGSRTLANVTNSVTGTLTVGTNGSFTILQLSDNALLNNSAHGVIGRNTTALFNEVRLTSATARWRIAANLYVGSDGAASRLAVSNGGRVENDDGFLGGNSASGGNLATVAGTGSLWSNRFDLHVGYLGSLNRLTIDSGARVESRISHIGYFSTSSNNTAVVSGTGSIWSNRFNLNVGFDGAGNRLVITNGGRAANGDAFLASTALSSNNEAVVTGPGSLWNNGLDLYAGYLGGGNRLLIADGGRVENRISQIGYFSTSDNNVVAVAGAGSIWSNRNSLNVGFDGSGNRLEVRDGGAVFAPNIQVGFSSLSADNRVVVDGGSLRATNAVGTGVLDVRRGTNVLKNGLVEADNLMLTNKARFNTVVAANGSLITIPTSFGAGNPYPSTITVRDMGGAVTKVTVTLSNLSSTVAGGMSFLLVGPTGKKVRLQNFAGGSFPVNSVALTFDDSAAKPIPSSGNLVSGTYRPTDNAPGNNIVAPAPVGPYSTNLSSFNGSSPNGVWSLYVANIATPNTGSLQGWNVQITTDERVDTAVFELNGGMLITRGASISNNLPFVVGGPGGVPAVWEVRSGGLHRSANEVIVGRDTPFNQLLLTAGANFSTDADLIVGADPALSSDNLVSVTGGALRALNAGGGTLDLRGGTNRIEAGLVDVKRLLVTNSLGQCEILGGTLRSQDSTIDNGRVFTVGGGASRATLELLGGRHTFANNIAIAANGSLTGAGRIDGFLTVLPDGQLTPGPLISTIDVFGRVFLQGTANLQIDKSFGGHTNDMVIVRGALFYGGTLNVTDIGADLPSVGDRFFLFGATSYVGSFATLNLPALAPGLAWRNNLAVDGSIEVTAAIASTPGFSATIRSGTNVVFSGTNGLPNASFGLLTATNVELPLSDWVVVLTNRFDALGRFQITNPVTPADRQRYFRLLTP